MGLLKRIGKPKKYDVEMTLQRIQEKRKNVEPGTEEFKRLQEAYEVELRNKQHLKETRWYGISLDKILLTTGFITLGVVALALETESPSAMKKAQFVVNLVKKL